MGKRLDFDHKHYVPILKGKEGEYLALRELAPDVKDALTPLIEPPSIPYDFVNELPAKTVDEHLGKVVEKIETNWGGDPLFIDLDWIPPSEVMADGRHPLKYIFDNARSRGLLPIPVTGLNRTTEYQAAVKDASDMDNRGVCIRLESDDLEDVSDLASNLDATLTFVGLPPGQIDLVIDLGSIAPAVGPMALAANSIIANLPQINDWRTLTLAATAFPQDLGGISARSSALLPRTEWAIWLSLAARRAKIRRLPTFGDYAIAHPQLVEVDPRLMKMSAQLRYTTDAAWLVFKERNVRDYGFEQFKGICTTLIGRPEYKGPAFSWGDNAINECTSAAAGPGNATTWRRIGTNHHLTLVTDQIASVPGL